MITWKSTCGHCRLTTRFEFCDVRFSAVPISPHEDDIIRYAGMALCNLCGKHSLIEFTQDRSAVECAVVNYVEYFQRGFHETLERDESIVSLSQYPSAKLEFHHSWPKGIGETLEAVQRQLHDGTPPWMPISACRMVLDVAVKQLNATGKDLDKKINDLHGRGEITQPLAEWAHRLRLGGNDAIHEGLGTADEARALFGFVTMFLHVCFTLPAEIAQHKNASSASP